MAELNIEGMVIAPGVVETIVSLAAQGVDGVSCVGDPTASGIRSIIGGKPSTQGIDIEYNEETGLHISLRLFVKSGQVLPELASQVRRAIADAINMQIGVAVGSVDIYIDGIQFDN